MATTINEDKLLAINDSLIQMAGNDAAIQNLQEQVSTLNKLAGEGIFEVSNTYDLVIHNDAEFNDVITKYQNGYTDGAGVSHPNGYWYNTKNMPAASVLITGALTLNASVTVPSNIKTLDFQGNGSMALKGNITGLNSSALKFEGDTTVTGLKIISGGGSVLASLISGGGSFINCSITLETETVGSAFYNAKSLYHCQVTGSSIFQFFNKCNDLFGCRAEGGSTENTVGYINCSRVTGCLAVNVSTAFTGCNNLSNCRGYTVKSVGFNDCSYINNCTTVMATEEEGTGFTICNHITGCQVEKGAIGYDGCSIMSACTSTAKKDQVNSHYPCNLWFEYTNNTYENVTLPSTTS